MVEPTRKPRLIGWGTAQDTMKIFPGADIYFDLQNKQGDLLDSAVPKNGESKSQFVKRVALDYEHAAGAPLPVGCRLVYSETYG